eukprot:15436662-Alexandrium_andersonii.AAC.2
MAHQWCKGCRRSHGVFSLECCECGSPLLACQCECSLRESLLDSAVCPGCTALCWGFVDDWIADIRAERG